MLTDVDKKLFFHQSYKLLREFEKRHAHAPGPYSWKRNFGRYVQCFRLRYGAGLSLAEVGKVQGISAQRAGMLQEGSLRVLRTLLAKNGRI